MQVEHEKPRRRVVLDLNMEGDSWEDIQRGLHSLQTEIAVSGSLSTQCVSGGYSSGWHFTSSEDDTITHDSWSVEIEHYCAALRTKEPIRG